MEYRGYECPQEVRKRCCCAKVRPHLTSPHPTPHTHTFQFINDYTPMEFEELVEQFDTYDVDGSKVRDFTQLFATQLTDALPMANLSRCSSAHRPWTHLRYKRSCMRWRWISPSIQPRNFSRR